MSLSPTLPGGSRRPPTARHSPLARDCQGPVNRSRAGVRGMKRSQSRPLLTKHAPRFIPKERWRRVFESNVTPGVFGGQRPNSPPAMASSRSALL